MTVTIPALEKPASPRGLISAWNGMSLRKKGYLVLIVPVLSLVSCAWLFHASLELENEARKQINQTIEVIDSISRLYGDIFRAVGAAYATFTTNEPDTDIRYQKAHALVADDLDRLARLTQNNADQSRNVAELSVLANRRLDLAWRLASHPNPLETMPEVVEQGRATMIQVFQKLAEMRAQEDQNLAANRQHLDLIKAKMRYSVGASLLLGLLGGIASMFFFTSSILRRVRRLEQTAQKLSPGMRLSDNADTLDELGRLDLAYKEALHLRQQHEGELHQHMERFRAIADYTYDWENWFSPKGELLWVNPAVARITGYTPEQCHDMEGFPIPLIHPDDRAFMQQKFTTALHGERGKDVEFRLVRKDGAVIWAAVSWQPIFDSNGENLGYRSSIRDITEKKTSREELLSTRDALQSRTRELDAVLSSVQDYIFMFDAKGRFVFANQKLLDLWGLSATEAFGKTMRELNYPEEAERAITQGIEHVLRTGEVFTNETYYTSPVTGEACYYENILSPVGEPGANSGYVAGASRDVTDFKRLVAESEEARKQADAANEAKSRFLANMSHEIRTPLNGIQGMLQLIQTTELDQEQTEYTDTALKSSRRLTSLLSDILDISRSEENRLELAEESFDLRESILALSQMFTPVARNSNLELRVMLDPDLPGVVIGDNVRIQQVLSNIIGNALKFTSKGHVELTVRRMAATIGSASTICFTITDTGIGMPQDKLDHLFEAFTQAESNFNRRFQGAGLGLAISKRLVDLMGGTISVSSEVDRGTSFELCLPLPEAQSDAALLPGREDAPADTEGAALRILLAEDDDISRKAQQTLLEKLGYQVVAVTNGRQALDVLSLKPFDIVLMDIQMPVMNGLDATQAIRNGLAGDNVKGIAVIATTAYAMPGDRQKFLEAGVDGYVPKPVERETIEEVIRSVLHHPPLQ